MVGILSLFPETKDYCSDLNTKNKGSRTKNPPYLCRHL